MVFTTWDPQEKKDGPAGLRIYDVDNRLVATTTPHKVSLRPRNYIVVRWPITVARLDPGVYRLDVVIDEVPQGRTYFRMLD